MIKNVLQEIGGIGIYALISLLLFFVVFTSALIWAAIQRQSFCAKMSGLPLDDACETNLVKGVASHE